MANDLRKLIWIASYPKSGNTWVRAFLANYLIGKQGQGPVPLDELVRLTRSDVAAERIASAGQVDLAGCSPAEVYAARKVYLQRLAEMDAPSFVKTHMPNVTMWDTKLLPAEFTKCAIYIVRNPLDVLASVGDQLGMTPDEAFEMMTSREARLAGAASQIESFVGNWSLHVRSWFAAEGFPVQVLRYEDMLDDPETAFRDVLEIVGIQFDAAQMAHAIEMSSFKQLSDLEQRDGFIERSSKQDRFFRQGIKTTGAGVPDAVRDRILAEHGTVMKHLKHLKYLNA